ncbi:PAS domain S-box-containing protein/diguanylate cyclase (GGDEF) domain-containing protein [Pseudoxanthobacter soli DSM 19599]|uniref:diguanylate cyclase n=1 Tax=Pseudoxanthobacter soli DSM 19599 TaxID=1123029 RepID=A0A1M7ZQ89_9HYPH|nr:GGDEF domain-containing protein [Pseudoxanthobacter soli]SHO67078.1 PAS domain S-box-containing protein/diguanylate cyclase (GGDEF) domain-containing protein [Pseudoxanthobacter soli DSM 19599]
MTAFEGDLTAKLALYSIDAIADMIIWTDRDGRYVSANKAAQRLLGFTMEEFRLRRVCDVDPLFSEERWREHWAELERLGTVTLETVNTRKDGVEVPIEVTANLVCVDGMRFNCSIVRDITERRRNEAKLKALNERIYQMSITDGLTGIGNRRRFDEALAGEVSRHACSGEPLALMLIDIDHFKAFNDRYGHLGGDDCLRRVAATIAATVDGSAGLAARFGGEEFACLLPGTALAETTMVADRLRLAVTDLAIPHALADAGIVTVSVGAVCSERVIAQTSNSLLAAADTLLYRAKREGRNRIAVGQY